MLDTAAIEQLVRQQIAEQVTEQVSLVIGSDEWLTSFEQRIIEFVQARVMAKFGNAEYLPEITNTVKSSVDELFKRGVIPGIDQYVDKTAIKNTIDVAVEQLVDSSVEVLGKDPVWLAKIEQQIFDKQSEVFKIQAKDDFIMIQNEIFSPVWFGEICIESSCEKI